MSLLSSVMSTYLGSRTLTASVMQDEIIAQVIDSFNQCIQSMIHSSRISCT